MISLPHKVSASNFFLFLFLFSMPSFEITNEVWVQKKKTLYKIVFGHFFSSFIFMGMLQSYDPDGQATSLWQHESLLHISKALMNRLLMYI